MGVLAREWRELLRCVSCGGEIDSEGEDELRCRACGTEYPVIDGVPRMLPAEFRDRLGPGESHDVAQKLRTGTSFAYEWRRFGEPRPEWRRNFLDYLQPHGPDDLRGKTILDVGTGSGRHAREAVAMGAAVVAVDVGEAIEVARANLPSTVLTVQADAERLPFRRDSFDMVMAIGVLHHLPDPARALRGLAPFVRPGGRLHVYLYWQPPVRLHRLVLRGVNAARRVTTRMSHGLLLALCYPLSVLLFATVVAPYKALRRFPRLQGLASLFPLKAYADYPWRVLVNDQFDRFSAPIEHRYTRSEVERMMREAGLDEVTVLPNNGWVADGRRPPGGEVGARPPEP